MKPVSSNKIKADGFRQRRLRSFTQSRARGAVAAIRHGGDAHLVTQKWLALPRG